MDDQNSQSTIISTEIASQTLKSSDNKKLILFTMLVFTVVGLLTWKYLDLSKKIQELESLPTQVVEVENNKKDIINTNEKTQGQMYNFDKQVGLPISFSFPNNYMVAGTDQEGNLTIFIDKEPILFLEGDVMPGIIQIKYSHPGSSTVVDYDMMIKNTLAGLQPETIEKSELVSVKGQVIKGVVAPGYMEGLTSITAIIETKDNPVSFSYLSDSKKDPEGLIEKDFYKIVESVQAL